MDRLAFAKDLKMPVELRPLDFYAQPSGMTLADSQTPLFSELSSDVRELVRIIQGLGVYDVVAPDFYGFAIPGEWTSEIHIRSTARMLERLRVPLTVFKPC